jgi:hypothetical protein
MLVIVLAVGVTLGAIWIISAAIIENIRFAKGTTQMMHLVTSAHTLAAQDKNFASQPNEDLLFDMMRIGMITEYVNSKPVTMVNPWNGAVRLLSPVPAMMRIETALPNHDCRRMALFFVKNSSDLGLKIVEVHGDNAQTWQRFYAPADGINNSNVRAIEDACNQSSYVTLAFVLTIR